MQPTARSAANALAVATRRSSTQIARRIVAPLLPTSAERLLPCLAVRSSSPACARALHSCTAPLASAASATSPSSSASASTASDWPAPSPSPLPSLDAPPSAASLPPVPLFQHCTSAAFLARPALVAGPQQHEVTYSQLLRQALAIRTLLQRSLGRTDLRDVRVAILFPGGVEYVSSLLGIWLAGGVAVPLHPAHAPPELEYLLEDSGCSVLIVGESMAPLAQGLTKPIPQEGEREMQVLQWTAGDNVPAAADARGNLPDAPLNFGSSEEFLSCRAMFIYTSGTTGKPKGVVWTHRMLEYQMRTLTDLWGWEAGDRTLCVLPLHHIHGVVNVLLCALYAGARCTFPPSGKASTEEIARALQSEEASKRFSVFMAVPTIYSQLLAWLRTRSDAEREVFRARTQRFRLMVSGSAALPVPVLDGWEAATGITLLERYGMSEAGMILSQPLDAQERKSMRGTVGRPLPGVEVKIVPMEGDAASSASASSSSSSSSAPAPVVGELRVRGPGIFSEYWNKPEKTASEFDEDGWFKTGDVILESQPCSSESAGAAGGQPVYKLLGRASVDVLKSGGYKISALDVERELLSHPAIEAAAVVGVPDEAYGQIVGAIVQLRPGGECSSAASLQQWCRGRMASYQVPRVWRVVSTMPRNAMGKTNKKELVKLFAPATQEKK